MAFVPGRCLLRERLKEVGMTQKQLAERLNLSPQKINDYASGERRMSLGTAKTVADILDCHIDDLYDWIHVPLSTDRRRRYD